MAEEDGDAGTETAGESKGVHSEAGGFPILARTSRLHTGQNVLQIVSQESTQTA